MFHIVSLALLLSSWPDVADGSIWDLQLFPIWGGGVEWEERSACHVWTVTGISLWATQQQNRYSASSKAFPKSWPIIKRQMPDISLPTSISHGVLSLHKRGTEDRLITVLSLELYWKK